MQVSAVSGAVTRGVGSVSVTEAVAEHPFSSVTVTVYVPTHKPVQVCVEQAVDQE